MLDHIKLDILTEDEITTQEHTLDGLWMLQYEDKTKGPFSTLQLRKYSAEHQEMFDAIQATNLLKNKFTAFYQNIEFQRRKPKLIQASSLVSDENFFVLIHGQKQGPFTLEEVKSKSDSKEIRLSSLVSTDKGHTWIKLYEHHEFDRRNRNVDSILPFSPEESFIHEAVVLGRESIKNAKKKQAEEDAIVGLAFLSHGKEHAINAHDVKSNTWSPKSSTKRKFGFKYATAFMVSALVITTTLLNSNTDTNSLNKTVKTTKRAINNTRRQPKRFLASVKEEKTVKEVKKYVPLPKKNIVKRPKVEPKRYIRKAAKKAPRRITHFADEFEDSEENFDNNREVASTDEPKFYPEDELTQEQIEAIELGDPNLLDEVDAIQDARSNEENF